jgi:CRISP-associated protein Cas1
MELMLIEARAAAVYFSAWKVLPVRWKSLKRFPVPEHWLRPTIRRSDWSRIRSTNRHASHPVNAMLNYGYGILHNQIQIALAAQGFDPRRGIMHESRDDCAALVLDLMEPFRPTVDGVVLKLLAKQAFSASDFTITREGVCRLNPQLAAHLSRLVVEELPHARLAEDASIRFSAK